MSSVQIICYKYYIIQHTCTIDCPHHSLILSIYTGTCVDHQCLVDSAGDSYYILYPTSSLKLHTWIHQKGNIPTI